jgi:hypothetical protein
MEIIGELIMDYGWVVLLLVFIIVPLLFGRFVHVGRGDE